MSSSSSEPPQHLFRAVREDAPGDAWRAHFERFWPAYERWFLKEGDAARPSLAQARAALVRHMPALVPTWERLVELAGGGERVARCLSLYRPTPFLMGCSQAVLTKDEPILVRNYDYTPELWEGTLLSTAWNGRRVVAMSDCLWGALDGMNDAGVAVALAFGGRRVVGDGFGMPLVLRYVLERASTTAEAERIVRRMPTNMAYNVTVVDAEGRFFTAELAPDRPPVVHQRAYATNHQKIRDWPEYVGATSSVERESYLAGRLSDKMEASTALVDAFLEPPLLSPHFCRGFGTLYTAVYHPRRGAIEVRWPGRTIELAGPDIFS